MSERGVLEQTLERERQPCRILWLDQQAIGAVLDEILTAAHKRRDAGQPTGHRLQKCIWHTFPTRRQHEAPRTLQQVEHIFTRPQQLHALADVELVDEAL